jgi:hypothetical protein
MVDGVEVRAAELAERITGRRTGLPDPALALLGDHPLQVAQHVGRHRRGISREMMEADIADAWMILELVAAQVDLARRRLIEAGTERPPHGAGMTYVQIAPLVGQTSRAGVEALRRRLEAASEGLVKDTKAARAHKRGGVSAVEQHDNVAVAAGVVVATLGRYRDQVPSELLDDLDDLLDELEAAAPGVAPTRLFAIYTADLVRALYARTLPVELRAVVGAAVERMGIVIRTPPGLVPGALESVSLLDGVDGKA